MSTKIYTGGGDKGKTSLVSGKRVSKAHDRIEAYGTIDELCSSLGIVGAELASFSQQSNLSQFIQLAKAEIQTAQNQLFSVGCHLACDDENYSQKLPLLVPDISARLENQIDAWTAQLPELKEFILPGGCKAASFLHQARTICRRAERLVTLLHENNEYVHPAIPIYLNRLSDYLFVFARYCNQQMGYADLTWKK